MDARAENGVILQRLSAFLCHHADAITGDMIRDMGMDECEAYRLLLASLLGLDAADSPADRALYGRYFPQMVKKLDAEAYRRDPYYQQVKIPSLAQGRWTFQQERYKPYEAFVYNDLQLLPDGRAIPQIGYFDEEFAYPAVLENGREWMLITPNEIETMKPAIKAARGRVLSYGLGLGYYAFMAARKQQVDSVTVIERDAEVIALFTRHILPQFEQPQKVTIIKADAFDYARQDMAKGRYDVVFTDLWHDPSDGAALYQRMKALEAQSPSSEYLYWIEKTLLYYID